MKMFLTEEKQLWPKVAKYSQNKKQNGRNWLHTYGTREKDVVKLTQAQVPIKDAAL